MVQRHGRKGSMEAFNTILDFYGSSVTKVEQHVLALNVYYLYTYSYSQLFCNASNIGREIHTHNDISIWAAVLHVYL